MSSWGSKDAKVHIANALAEDLYVLVTPNPDWVWADLAAVIVTTVVSEVASGGAATGAAAAEVSSFTRALKSAEAIATEIGQLRRLREFKYLEEVRKVWEALEKMHEVYEAVSEAYEAAKTFTAALPSDEDINSWQNQITAFFHDKVKIGAGEAENVADEDFLEPWRALEPSYWGAMSGASTVHVLLVSESLGLCAGFNTDPDHSWIATPQGVVRAHYGSLWTPDPGAGVHHWNGRSSPGLLATKEIRRGAPLRSPNGRFSLALHRNGDLVVEDSWFREPVWRSNTAGSGATRALFNWDGRLTLLTERGEMVWVSPFAAPPIDRDGSVQGMQSARRASRLELRDDGEIVAWCATVVFPYGPPADCWQRPERELKDRRSMA